MIARRSAISCFVSYASCLEEKKYCDNPDSVVRILSQVSTTPAHQCLSAFETTYERTLFEELLNPEYLDASDFETVRRARAGQLALYVLVLECLKGMVSIADSAAFSAGYGPLFVAAGVLSASDWLQKTYPANGRYAADNLKLKASGSLHTRLLCCYSSSNFSNGVKEIVENAGLTLDLKDDRGPYAIQFTGQAAELEEASRMLEQAGLDFGPTSTRLLRTDGAHVKPERYNDIQDAFLRMPMASPAFRIATHGGQVLHEDASANDLAEALFDALHAPLSMGAINQYLCGIDGPVVHIGSRRTARFAFYGFGSRRFAADVLHWEDVLLGITDQPLETPQDSPRW